MSSTRRISGGSMPGGRLRRLATRCFTPSRASVMSASCWKRTQMRVAPLLVRELSSCRSCWVRSCASMGLVTSSSTSSAAAPRHRASITTSGKLAGGSSWLGTLFRVKNPARTIITMSRLAATRCSASNRIMVPSVCPLVALNDRRRERAPPDAVSPRRNRQGSLESLQVPCQRCRCAISTCWIMTLC